MSRRDAELYRTAAVASQQSAAKARANMQLAGREAELTSALQPTLTAELEKATAKRQRALAALELAEQDRGHTVIRATVDGVVGNLQARVGDYVQAGSRLMT